MKSLLSFITLPVVSTVLRAALKFGGGFLVARGIASGEELETAIAAVLALVGVIWGILAKKKPAEAK